MDDSGITISDLEIMTRAYNYRNWIYRRVAPFLGRRILEVGTGIGNFTTLLLDRELVVAVDKHPGCVEYLRNRLDGSPKVIPMLLDIAGPATGALSDYGFDTVVCLNVLEHIEDELRALTNMRAVLQPGGVLVLLVPAFQFLYGSVDRSLEHYRRYTRKHLVSTVEQAGFQLEKAFYMNVIGIAGWFLNNRILKRREESGGQVEFFDRFVAPWAERIERLVQPPIGLSLIAICRNGEWKSAEPGG